MRCEDPGKETGRAAQQPTGLTLPSGACGAAGETCKEILLRKAQTVDKSKTTVIFHKEKRIRMSNI